MDPQLIYIHSATGLVRKNLTGVEVPQISVLHRAWLSLSILFFSDTGPVTLPATATRFVAKQKGAHKSAALLLDLAADSVTISGQSGYKFETLIDSESLRVALGEEESLTLRCQVEWLPVGAETISLSRPFDLTITQAYSLGSEDEIPQPVADAWDAGLSARALRFDQPQSLTPEQQAQAQDNLGVTPGGGGVTIHSALTGLGADDHPQYHNNSRGDDRYSPLGHTHAIAGITGLQAELDAKAASSHTHAIAGITGLQAELDGKAASSHTHAIAGVTGLQDALDAKAAGSHTHAIAGVTGLQAELDGKAASSHTHAIAGVTGLQAELDAKAASSHTHAIAGVTGLQTALDAKSATGHTHTPSQVGLGNVPNVDARARSSHTGAQTQSTIVGLQDALAAKASRVDGLVPVAELGGGRAKVAFATLTAHTTEGSPGSPGSAASIPPPLFIQTIAETGEFRLEIITDNNGTVTFRSSYSDPADGSVWIDTNYGVKYPLIAAINTYCSGCSATGESSDSVMVTRNADNSSAVIAGNLIWGSLYVHGGGVGSDYAEEVAATPAEGGVLSAVISTRPIAIISANISSTDGGYTMGICAEGEETTPMWSAVTRPAGQIEQLTRTPRNFGPSSLLPTSQTRFTFTDDPGYAPGVAVDCEIRYIEF